MLEKRSAVESADGSKTVGTTGRRFAIVAGRWNFEFILELVRGAREAFSASGVKEDDVEIFYVPGSFELPLAAKKAAETGRFDAIVAIGVIIRGDTPHFDVIAAEAARGIGEVALQTGIPVLFGVITANTPEQAAERSGPGSANKGFEAATAAIELAALYADMDPKKGIEKVDKAFPHVV